MDPPPLIVENSEPSQREAPRDSLPSASPPDQQVDPVGTLPNGDGMAADVGTLQRLPKIVGNNGWVREVCYTGRRFAAQEALHQGLVTAVCPDRDALMAEALKLAKVIASKSPVAIAGTKESLVYARDHSVPDSLKQIGYWNMAALQTPDMMTAMQASLTKTTPIFSKL